MAREVTLYRVYPEKVQLSGDHVEISQIQDGVASKTGVPVRTLEHWATPHYSERMLFALDQPLDDIFSHIEGQKRVAEQELESEQEHHQKELTKVVTHVRSASFLDRLTALFLGGRFLLSGIYWDSGRRHESGDRG